MTILKKLFACLAVMSICHTNGVAQSMHFSQYYNAPQLLNPANTALMPEYDYRAGLNYRNQWAAVPVPYNTFSAFGDFKVGGNNANKVSNNWLGIGLAFFNDKAGDGNLALTKVQGSIAYHLQLSEFTMFSLGFSAATVNRSVNFDQLTFNNQWDGFKFNTNLSTGEKPGLIHTQYYTGGTGLNFAWFPNEEIYVKVGGGVSNVNQPVESFYGGTNKLMMRESGNLDMFFHTGSVFTINPSVYYATQSGAAEIVGGTMVRINLNGPYDENVTQLIFGGYLRVGDAVIGAAGLQYRNWQMMASYDFTISGLAPYNASYGALEMSIIYQGVYGRNRNSIKKSLGCPRFF